MSKNKNIILALLVSLFAVSCLLIGIFTNKTILAEQPVVEYVGEGVKAEYELGNSLVLPQAEIDVDGVNYPVTSHSVLFPNGKAYSQDSYVLSVPGKYTVKYFAKVNDKTVTAVDRFVVKAGAYSVSGTNSSAYYGNTGDKGSFDGIIVSLAPGDVFTYEKVIDLRGKKQKDLLLNLYALPEFQGISDVTSLYVRLTDAYDSTNYVDIATFASRANPNEVADAGKEAGALYSAAGAYNQGLTGIHWWSEDVATAHNCVYYDNGWYSIRKGITNRSGNGYPSKAFSFSARNGYGVGIRKTQTDGYTLSFDYDKKKIYGCEPNSAPSNGLIADLDDSLFFDNLWQGFTNGEVKLSIFADNYVNSSFNFVVTKIYDEDLRDNSYIVSKNPEIVVDYSNNGSAPLAISNQPYKVFGATAYSVIDGVKPCTALVYKDYYSSTKQFVNVNANGEFIPTEVGVPYHIVYGYTDTFGNTATKVVEIKVIPQAMLDINLGSGTEQAYTGETALLKTPTVQNANGNYALKVYVGREELTEISPDADGNYRFIGLYSGEYTVKYIATDYTSQKEASYTLNLTTNPSLVAVDDVILPVTFVKDASYLLPELEVYSFTDGDYKKSLAEITYKLDDGVANAYTLGSYIKVSAQSTVTVIYSLNQQTVKTYTVPVTDVGLGDGRFQKANYFYGTDFERMAMQDCILYTTSVDNSTLDFIKPLLVNEFSWKFGFNTLAFRSMSVTLPDTKNPDKTLKITVGVVSENEISLQVNNGEIKKFYLSLASGNHTLKYVKGTDTVFIDNYSYEVYDFVGFEKLTANMSVRLEGVSGSVELKAYNVNGSSLDSTESDYVLPTYCLDVDSGSKSLGEYISVNDFYVEDVIRFYTTKALTVKDPEGNVCRAEDGTLMNNVTDFSKNYKIKVSVLGKYTISVKFGDGENEGKASSYVYAVDKNAPVLTINEGYAKTCAVGQAFSIASYTVTDNADKDLKVTVMVMNPYGRITVIDNGVGLYSPSVKGTYTVLFRVTDSNGNVTTSYYEVFVK